MKLGADYSIGEGLKLCLNGVFEAAYKQYSFAVLPFNPGAAIE